MEPQAHYGTTDDGAGIAYSVEGDDGYTPIAFVPGWVSHLELDAQTRDALRVTEVLNTVRFSSFDKRGTGLSSRAASDYSLALRIGAQADGGQIPFREPVRHLLAGKAFVFADRGQFVPKDFEDAVRLYEVRWRDA